MIEFKNVSLSYQNKLVLKRINLQIADGEFCVLIGASGCGKTTLLKLINKLNKATSGKVLIDNEDINNLPTARLPSKIGYVVQEAGLFPHLNIAENIALSLQLAKYPKSLIQPRIDEMLEMVNLDPELYKNLYPSQLSGGQRQRVGVARAFAPDPAIVLMDEPFSALDPITRANLQDEICKIQENTKKTIVFVTHDMDEAIKLASRICILEEGTIAQIGTPSEILKHPVNKDIEEFIGTDKLWSNPDLIKAEEIMLKNPPVLENTGSIHDAKSLMRRFEINKIFITHEGKFIGSIDSQAIKWALWGSGNFNKFLDKDSHFVTTKTTLQEMIDSNINEKEDLIAVVDENMLLQGYLTKQLLLTILSKQFISAEINNQKSNPDFDKKETVTDIQDTATETPTATIISNVEITAEQPSENVNDGDNLHTQK